MRFGRLLVVLLAACSSSVAFAQAEGEKLPVTGPAFQNHLLTKQWSELATRLPTRPMDDKALVHAAHWQSGEEAPDPTVGRDGRVRFRFGTAVTVFCAPLRVCDIELEAGETFTSLPHTGDDEGWDVTPLKHGGLQTTEHVIVKATGPNLTTNLIVPTDRRIYHINLRSTANEDERFTPFVAFTYPDDRRAKWQAYLQSGGGPGAAPAQAPVKGAEGDELHIDLTSVDTNYEIHKRGRWLLRRRIKWAPVRAWDNGKKTIIEMPSEITSHELPTLLVCEDSQSDCNGDGDGKVVNFRVKGHRFVVDRLFENAVLIKAVGRRHQERVSINHIAED